MKYLVIGGAGFIGINFCKRILENQDELILFDNFDRRGSRDNVVWLEKLFGEIRKVEADVRYDFDLLCSLVSEVDVVYHLAGQVAVTSSVKNPRHDFENNLLGTFNVCEAVRLSSNKPILIYASTNKVYGGMKEVEVLKEKNRYIYGELREGISEAFPLDFHSPYGCSKGAGDQYVRDYARIYNLKTVVFRQSCIYGPRQFGHEDQGWIAWFTIATNQRKQISIYGDGMQVRDILHVDDLFNAWKSVESHIETASGQAYNIGGGFENVLSLLELVGYLEKFQNRRIPVSFSSWRPGDQKVYISNIAKVKKDLNWQPKIKVAEGVELLHRWVSSNPMLFQEVPVMS